MAKPPDIAAVSGQPFGVESLPANRAGFKDSRRMTRKVDLYGNATTDEHVLSAL